MKIQWTTVVLVALLLAGAGGAAYLDAGEIASSLVGLVIGLVAPQAKLAVAK